MFKGRSIWYLSLFLAVTCAAFFAVECATWAASGMQSSLETFMGRAPEPSRKSRTIKYDWDLSREQFVVAKPANYSSGKKYGLLVYISPSDNTELPKEWEAVLARRDMLYISPVNAGNEQDTARRLGLAVAAALSMQKKYSIDQSRIYVSGFSGGGRMATALGYLHPEIFSGAIGVCGATFIREVPLKKATHQVSVPYTVIIRDPFVDEAKVMRTVRFALVSGSGDFRYGHMLDIFDGGYKPGGYQAKFFDQKGMGHSLCSGSTLTKVLTFIDHKQGW